MLTKSNQNVALKRSRTSTFAVQPAGYTTQPANDFWLHMEFDFHKDVSDVVCVSWFITTAFDETVELSSLSYSQVQFLAQAMTEELEYHKRLYYTELEQDAYAFHQRHERD